MSFLPQWVEFNLAHSVARTIMEGAWPGIDCPRGGAAINDAYHLGARGIRVTMHREDAVDLYEYLGSVIGVVESMSREERGGQDLTTIRANKARLGVVLGLEKL